MNDNPLKTIPARDVKVGGLMGRRIELTWQNNLLAVDWDRDFLAPFLAKNSDPGAYIGLGKSLDGLVRLAAHTGDERLLAKRRHIMDTLLRAQEADGYLGHYRPADRGIPTWDAHEQACTPLVLRQHTDYPHSGQVRLDVEPARPARFALRLRRPAWCTDFAVAVNGVVVSPVGGPHFLAISREWRPGDQVTIAMPMPWRLVRGFRKQTGKVAALRGPQLYSLLAPVTVPVKFLADSAEADLGLRPFPDPTSRATYFACTDSPLTTDDELFPPRLSR